jgi:hypothetical protein
MIKPPRFALVEFSSLVKTGGVSSETTVRKGLDMVILFTFHSSKKKKTGVLSISPLQSEGFDQ